MHDDLCPVIDENGKTRHVFVAEAPNELWLTDITEHKTAEGKLYLCAIKDMFGGQIVGYSIDSRMKSRLGHPSARERRRDAWLCGRLRGA